MKAERLVLGLALLAVGVVWILVNVGVIPARSAVELWRYWPVLLIIWGVLLLTGRGGGGLGCLFALLIPILLASAFFTFSFPFHSGQAGPVIETEFSLPRSEQSEILELDLIHNAGELSLTSDISPHNLLTAKFRVHLSPEVEHTVADGVTKVTIRDVDITRNWRNHFSRWELQLASQVPVQLSLRTGATKAELDLRFLQMEKLDLKTGAGDVTIYLGTNDGIVNIDSGASNVVVYVPLDTGIRMQVRGGLVSVSGENAGIVSRGDRFYSSRELEQKEAVVDINFTAGAASITLRPAPPGRSI
jgi:hypothetical protein